MPLKTKAKKKTKAPKQSKVKAGGGLLKSAGKAISGAIGGSKGGGGKRRSKGPQYWANKVIVQKLKSKYFKLKYRGV